MCDVTDNLWMNLTDGSILCGRKYADGWCQLLLQIYFFCRNFDKRIAASNTDLSANATATNNKNSSNHVNDVFIINCDCVRSYYCIYQFRTHLYSFVSIGVIIAIIVGNSFKYRFFFIVWCRLLLHRLNFRFPRNRR